MRDGFIALEVDRKLHCRLEHHRSRPETRGDRVRFLLVTLNPPLFNMRGLCVSVSAKNQLEYRTMHTGPESNIGNEPDRESEQSAGEEADPWALRLENQLNDLLPDTDVDTAIDVDKLEFKVIRPEYWRWLLPLRRISDGEPEQDSEY